MEGIPHPLLAWVGPVTSNPAHARQGIAGHGFYDSCVVPVIENTARECELTGRLREAMAAYPRSNAVLVRRHGIYIWGDTWLQVRTSSESVG